MKELTTKNVNETFMSCLFKDDEPHDNFIGVKGITINIGFHPGRVEENKQDIHDYLSQLPHTFRKDEGGGWSFLKACITEDGRQWGEHRDMEKLFMMGEAAGYVECLMPREMWSMLPGGVPYYAVNL